MIVFLHQHIVFSLNTAKGHRLFQPGLLLQIGDHVLSDSILIVYFHIGITLVIIGIIDMNPEFLKFPKPLFL